MSLQDFFYLSLSIACIVFIISMALISYFLVALLKSLKNLVDKMDETTKGVRLLKDNLKIGVLSILNILFNIWSKKRR
ncbi:hypothetical protein HYS92_02515 [Candidatus Daviesbacteria bacterium]|nr:hypothetical protein [Candidatus Daviesbacteria bacterium]